MWLFLCCLCVNFFPYTFYSLKDERLRFPINVDGHFLTKPVDEQFHERELLTVPFMTGINNDEGGWLLSGVSVNAKLLLKFVRLI